MNDKPIRVGLMGCGTVADYGHIPAIQATPGLTLQALFDPCAGAADRLRAKYAVPEAHTDLDAFFGSGLDAVSITSPAPCHKQNVLAAARHGLPAICEKPLAMDGREARAMIAAMDRAGASLYTAFCYRFSPCALRIRELVRAKAIGEVRSLRLIYNWGCHGKYETDATGRRVIQERRAGRMREGGPMVDCGTHQIDLARFWLDSEVVAFDGHGAWVDEYEAPDHLWLHMDHACGAHTVVEISYSYHHTAKQARSEFVYELIGTEGVIRYDRGARQFTMETGAGTQTFDFHEEKSFEGLYAAWARALETGQSDLLTGAAEGMRVTEIARKATNAAIKSRRLTKKNTAD